MSCIVLRVWFSTSRRSDDRKDETLKSDKHFFLFEQQWTAAVASIMCKCWKDLVKTHISSIRLFSINYYFSALSNHITHARCLITCCHLAMCSTCGMWHVFYSAFKKRFSIFISFYSNYVNRIVLLFWCMWLAFETEPKTIETNNAALSVLCIYSGMESCF